ncbi:pyrroline-5-carboxylate reductase [Dictyostelium discoideum AX4]|uniref:Pyrroline-5-carboxylate reductase 1 n=1 Tax=Dictyostelium discoideum TaxID=44689 RepID=P5CR1_DICDI|nr:pyrroline-5-carboxylate reductase [Dictyostelium discoideum AX4]Q54IL7.1 RecName: Full=Pyrroline-5-carboxylate reductase 1; Short=P5C reductase 1; Short=P5CR 1 [Dictyostelium discoideum]EAL63112.1 pyrroline-5-carboxylate reductase [Dictyostelium discoideum AX4]|eukprot:XP_636614.1 pyrroline-5-carboxylate reductase [Dictyostelium discoideum AX4]
MKLYDNGVAVLGCGNLGNAIAKGLVASKQFKSNQIVLTKRNLSTIEPLKREGYHVTTSNHDAVSRCKIVIVCVVPAQLDDLLDSIKQSVTENHIIISVVSGASIEDIRSHLEKDVPIVRAMPNTAIQHCQSMTCLAIRSSHQKSTNSPSDKAKDNALEVAKKIFNCLGMSIVLSEEQIVPATALCACGIAFFCRAIRAAAQGGCEIGFHAEDAIRIAAQTAKGAATLLLENNFHPEYEIDKVTTPQGCTIAGLNQMEHAGFSSAMIKGIVTSSDKAASLYTQKQQNKKQQQLKQQQHQQHQHQQHQQHQQQVQQQEPHQYQQQQQQSHQQSQYNQGHNYGHQNQHHHNHDDQHQNYYNQDQKRRNNRKHRSNENYDNHHHHNQQYQQHQQPTQQESQEQTQQPEQTQSTNQSNQRRNSESRNGKSPQKQPQKQSQVQQPSSTTENTDQQQQQQPPQEQQQQQEQPQQPQEQQQQPNVVDEAERPKEQQQQPQQQQQTIDKKGYNNNRRGGRHYSYNNNYNSHHHRHNGINKNSSSMYHDEKRHEVKTEQIN